MYYLMFEYCMVWLSPG